MIIFRVIISHTFHQNLCVLLKALHVSNHIQVKVTHIKMLKNCALVAIVALHSDDKSGKGKYYRYRTPLDIIPEPYYKWLSQSFKSCICKATSLMIECYKGN